MVMMGLAIPREAESTAVGPHHQAVHLQLLDKLNIVIRKLEPKLAEEMDLFTLLVF